MKTKSFIAALLLLFCATSMWASDTSVDGIWYIFDSNTNTAIVTFMGSYSTSYTGEYSGDVTIPEFVTFNNITYHVTRIGSEAFGECYNLRSISLPSSITSIGSAAFYECRSLTSIDIPNSVTSIENQTFYKCYSLSSIIIGENVTDVKNKAFGYCTKLSSVIMQRGTPPSLGTDVFDYCNNLKNIYVPCGSMNIYKKNWSRYSSIVKYLPREYSLSCLVNITEAGSVEYPYNICEDVILTITANYGYHFLQWSDGNTDNPRTIELTRDTTFTAEFAKNSYSITTASSNPEWGTTAGDAIVLYQEQTKISATANYGYHFVSWNDNNTINPRTILVTKDETYTASFAKNTYIITKIANNGSISGKNQAAYLDQVTLTPVPNYGYHFVQWSDGNTDNPRTIELTSDTTFTAEFAKNSYSIATATSPNAEWGTTSGDATVLYQDQVEISATANYGYHFAQWNDGNSSNPRTITVTKDATYTATFAKNTYKITKITDNTQGSISGSSQAYYLDQVTLTAVPKYGYHFTQWSDGVTDNPRTFELTRDTTFTAEFAVDKSGTCGDNNLLTWVFDAESKTLAISGEGKLNSNYTFGVEAPTQTERLIIAEGVTSIGNNAFKDKCSTVTALALPSTVTTIGDYAFAGLSNRKFNTLVLPNTIISIGSHAFDGASYLQTIHFGSVLEEIGDYAFNGCTRVRKMTCLAEITPNVGTDGLTSISDLAELHVPNDYLFDYQLDNNWNRFVLKPIGSTEATVTGNDVTIVADENSATITWPTSAADSYTIEITKDGVVFCQLIFNASGQLTSIAFAPSRGGQSMAPAATMTANGMQFTVTGLNSGTNYGYKLEAKSGSTTVVSYSGSFVTTGGIATGIDEVNAIFAPQKVLRNGNVLILRDGKTYTIQGVEVK